MRYDGQEHTLSVSIGADYLPAAGELRKRFADQHQLAYGFVIDDAVQIVACGLRAVGLLPKTRLEPGRNGAREQQPQTIRPLGRRLVTHRASEARAASWSVYRRGQLIQGAEVEGPAIIEEQTTTTVVPPSWTAAADAHGNLILEPRAA
jgi:N-methylhydantoinase A